MTEQITSEIFKHLVELAALELSAEEGEYVRGQLNNQLKAIHELEAIPLDVEIAVSAHGISYTPQTSPALRKDEWKPFSNPASILNQAPDTSEGYVVVPDISHTTLE